MSETPETDKFIRQKREPAEWLNFACGLERKIAELKAEVWDLKNRLVGDDEGRIYYAKWKRNDKKEISK